MIAPTTEQRAEWRRDAESWGPLGGDIRSDRILALLDALDTAEAHGRLGWDVHAEHVDRANAIIAKHARDATFERLRAERAEAALARVEALTAAEEARVAEYNARPDRRLILGKPMTISGILGVESIRAALSADA